MYNTMQAEAQDSIDLVQTQRGLTSNLPNNCPLSCVFHLKKGRLKDRIETPVKFHRTQAIASDRPWPTGACDTSPTSLGQRICMTGSPCPGVILPPRQAPPV